MIVNNFPDDVIAHAKNELELISLNNTEVAEAITNLIKVSANYTKNNILLMNIILEMPLKLTNSGVLSPIQENDFDMSSNVNNVVRCSRCFHIWKNLNDGSVYDDHFYAFIRKDDPKQQKFYMSQGKYVSTQKVTLPYIPVENIVYID